MSVFGAARRCAGRGSVQAPRPSSRPTTSRVRSHTPCSTRRRTASQVTAADARMRHKEASDSGCSAGKLSWA
eukprot:459040-Pleurochrysis_carterae.AAC.6